MLCNIKRVTKQTTLSANLYLLGLKKVNSKIKNVQI